MTVYDIVVVKATKIEKKKPTYEIAFEGKIVAKDKDALMLKLGKEVDMDDDSATFHVGILSSYQFPA